MSGDYTWSRDGDAYHFLTALPNRRRRLLERAIQALAAHPFRPPLFSDQGPDGERLDIVEVDGHLVTFHVEHAVRRIRVIEICPYT